VTGQKEEKEKKKKKINHLIYWIALFCFAH